ncbi:HEAT repeat domain-containing protein [Paenibacillus pedocola]|uniref:HEAT repeat domain-containing protein n=1 Tax=Paenibacillus pedocola TaxID=3242193 RepID=UPI00287787D4|nr:HEAT repeat domain-containing protein [Paenibacillus typhae]
MSTALLQELHQEVRRLYIAGSDLAADDFRLKRLLPQFQQLGERAAVFKRLGEGVAALLKQESAGEAAPAVKLQELTLLLESVLYTQGSTSPAGIPGELPRSSFTLETKVSYRKLAAVRQALTTTGSGRYETVVEAFNEGIFQDLRLLPLAIGALSDPYAEIAEFAMKQILPSYGPAIADYLMREFDPSGGKSDVRKLQVIGEAGGTELLPEIFKAAENGSDDVRVAAIGCLAGHEAYTPSLLEWTNDKKKPIREAAFTAVAAGGSQAGMERLFEAFAGKKDRALAAEAIAKWPSAPLAERLSVRFMEELQEALQQDNTDKKKNENVWTSIQPYLTALEEAQNPLLDQVYSFVIQNYEKFIALGWLPLLDQAAYYEERAASEQGLELLRELEQRNSRYLPHYFRAAQQLLSAKELYKQFGGTMMSRLKSKVSKEAAKRDQQLLETLGRQIINAESVVYEVPWDSSRDRQQIWREMLSADKIAAAWDPRWLDWFIDQDALDLVCAFARPNSPAALNYLLGKLQEQSGRRRGHDYMLHIFMGLERAGLAEPERQELLMSILEKDRLYNPYMIPYYLFHLMLRFPASYFSRIEAIVPNYRYESKTQLEYLLNHLQRQ